MPKRKGAVDSDEESFMSEKSGTRSQLDTFSSQVSSRPRRSAQQVSELTTLVEKLSKLETRAAVFMDEFTRSQMQVLLQSRGVKGLTTMTEKELAKELSWHVRHNAFTTLIGARSPEKNQRISALPLESQQSQSQAKVPRVDNSIQKMLPSSKPVSATCNPTLTSQSLAKHTTYVPRPMPVVPQNFALPKPISKQTVLQPPQPFKVTTQAQQLTTGKTMSVLDSLELRSRWQPVDHDEQDDFQEIESLARKKLISQYYTPGRVYLSHKMLLDKHWMRCTDIEGKSW